MICSRRCRESSNGSIGVSSRTASSSTKPRNHTTKAAGALGSIRFAGCPSEMGRV